MTDGAQKIGRPHWLRIVLIGRRPRYTAVRIVVLSGFAFVVFGFILLPVRIDGPSMLPNYRAGGVNLVNRFAYLRHDPRRGEVVTIRISGTEYSCAELFRDLKQFHLDFTRLSRPSLLYMKRVVALPGETIEFSEGRLLVNGQPLREPYLKFPCRWERAPQKLGPNQFFVVGDNRAMRMMDHTFGAAELSQIVGRVLL